MTVNHLPYDRIAINQLGYRGLDEKVAIIKHYEGRYTLKDAHTHQERWSGSTSPLMQDVTSGASVSKANFSTLQRDGEY